MEILVNEFGNLQLERVFNPITLKTPSGEALVINMRDTGFEFWYQGKTYTAKNGAVQEGIK